MKKILLLLCCIIANNTFALLKIDISKQGVDTMPIAVADFSGESNSIADIIRNNLKHAGYFAVYKHQALSKNIDFNAFKKDKVEAVISGKVAKNSRGEFEVSFFVYDVWTQKTLLSQKVNIGSKIIRRVGHIISDKVHFALLGEEGFFDSNIAYVSVNKGAKLPYTLEVVDSDGFNPQTVLRSKEPIMSPSWSPNNRSLAYVSFASGKSKVYIQNIFNKNSLITLPVFNGIVSNPAWHPNGKSLLITLSKNDNQDIYQYFLASEKLKRITTHSGIDTEASFSPNGKQIVWTSNRSGNAGIYIKNSNGGSAKKLPILGGYNVNPSFSPDGKKIIFIHSNGYQHKVAEFEIATGDMVILTDNYLDESPSYAPSGNMVIYSYNRYNKTYLSAVSTNGLFGFKLSDGTKEVREPVWSRFL
jgi:TolB protein